MPPTGTAATRLSIVVRHRSFSHGRVLQSAGSGGDAVSASASFAGSRPRRAIVGSLPEATAVWSLDSPSDDRVFAHRSAAIANGAILRPAHHWSSFPALWTSR